MTAASGEKPTCSRCLLNISNWNYGKAAATVETGLFLCLAAYFVLFNPTNLTAPVALVLICLLFSQQIKNLLLGFGQIIGRSESVKLQIAGQQIELTRSDTKIALQTFLSDSVNKLKSDQQSLFLYIYENRILTHREIGKPPFEFKRHTALHDDFSALRDALLIKPAKEDGGRLKVGGSWQPNATIYITEFAEYIVRNGLLQIEKRFDETAFDDYVKGQKAKPGT